MDLYSTDELGKDSDTQLHLFKDTVQVRDKNMPLIQGGYLAGGAAPLPAL